MRRSTTCFLSVKHRREKSRLLPSSKLKSAQKERVRVYLEERESRKAEVAFAERLRSNVSLKLFLKEPEQPVYQISTDDQPAKGSQTAPVTIVEFTDYQCPSCA